MISGTLSPVTRENNEKLSVAFAEFAADKGITAAQLALAWVLAQGEHIIPTPGTKRRKYLEENATTIDVTLTRQDIEEIERLLNQYPNIGPRYSAREDRFVKK